MPPKPPPKRSRRPKAVVKGVGEQTSPGGTKDVDFTVGTAEDQEAAMLDNMLAMEDPDYHVSPKRNATNADVLDVRDNPSPRTAGSPRVGAQSLKNERLSLRSHL